MKIAKLVLKIIGIVLLIFALYIIIVLAQGTITDFQPEDKMALTIDNAHSRSPIADSVDLTFVNWNIGYCGLGSESDFFYDAGYNMTSGGMMVTPKKDVFEKNMMGVISFLRSNRVDFVLLQEVDTDSKRSQYVNTYAKFGEELKGYEGTFAVNYNVDRVPLPILEPFNTLGRMTSGLATYAKYHAEETTRYKFPGKFGWPTRVFQLDRCFALHRYKVSNGKELVVINTHNSAYDKGGVMKKQQMEYLKGIVMEEYETKGNYVIVGGDWNQCPPDFQFDSFKKAHEGQYRQMNIAKDYLPEGWTWAYDPKVPTNRKMTTVYDEKESFRTLIDFYLLSPNVELKVVKGIHQNFEFSDHQPVFMKVRLKSEE